MPPKVSKVQIDEHSRAVLQRALDADNTDGPHLKLTETLGRDAYERVNKVVEALGGKWSRKLRCHVFPDGVEAHAVVAEALADGHAVDQRKTLQQFFSPPAVVERLIVAARLGEARPTAKVLEPSFGDGRIIDAVAAVLPKADIHGVEIDERLFAGVAQRYSADAITRMRVQLWRNDFMDWEAPARYDRVLMNPPFNGGQDVEHVACAFGLLAPGGVLVAVMAAGWTFRSDKRSREFTQLVERNGNAMSLPAGSFSDSGTEVNAVLVQMFGPSGRARK